MVFGLINNWKIILFLFFLSFSIFKIIPLIQEAQAQQLVLFNFKQLNCLEQNIYYEASGEPFKGKLAVGIVTLNRKNLKNKTICEIVYEPGQFSWTLNPFNTKTVFTEDIQLAAKLVTEYPIKIYGLENAIYFHNKSVNPAWSKVKTKVATIGQHIFYSE
jgi:spore germination cell wall hydrolase CwlJ-like protein